MKIEHTADGEEFRVEAEGEKPQFFTDAMASIQAFHSLIARKAKKVTRHRRLGNTPWQCVDFTVS